MNPVSLSRASSTASADPLPLHGHNPSHRSSSGTTASSAPQSTFKNCLKAVDVPAPLQQGGIHIVRVYANGKTRRQYMTLSPDKFTLYITSQPYNPATAGQNKRGSGWFLRRATSAGNSNSGNGTNNNSGNGNNNNNNGIGHNGNNAAKEGMNRSISEGYADKRSGDAVNNNNNNINNNIVPLNNNISSNSSNSNSNHRGNIEIRAIDIGAIHRIQRGHANRRFEMLKIHKQDSLKSLLSSGSAHCIGGNEVTLNPEQCFSIIFRGDWTLDLMMTYGQMIARDEVLDALDRVIQTYQDAKKQVSNDVLLLRFIWLDVDKDKSNTIKPNELGGVLDRINYQMKKSQLNDLYDNFSKVIGLDRKDRRHGLTFEQTCTLLHKIKRDSWMVKPINQYWNKLFGELMNNGKPRQTVSDKTFLEKFLHETQGETKATLQHVQKLFAKLNELELPYVAGEGLPKDPRRIDKNRFEAYLLGQDNDAFDPVRESFQARCMKRPISEYWINSSHNTYLTGDQLTSNSSIDMYSNALYRGCKCLELDVWDGTITADEGPTPVVWHGHTMTSKILFKDIIKAIKLFLNFHPDTFPLILSFENHCSVPYQEAMADQLVRILGNSLYIPKEDSLLGRLPSPWDLRGMVVIKGRRPSNMEIDDYDDDNSDDGAPSTVYTGDGTSMQSQQLKSVQHRVAPALARLTLFHGTKLKGWDVSVMNPTHHMHSYSENKMRSLCRKTDRRKWTIYNQSHMSRCYPAGSRVDSSNYMPILPWSVGTQMVALNFQTVDTALLLNDGRFRENGGCGYILKPSGLMDLQDPTQDEPRVPMKLSLRVLSGSCLPKASDARAGDCIDPYVKVSVFDVRNGDKESFTTFSTSVVTANGFFPIWNGEKFSFRIENHAVAMLQLCVYDKKSSLNATSTDVFVASASIPISCLRRGLRSVKLFDTSNTRSGAFDFASLLVDVKKERADVPMAEI